MRALAFPPTRSILFSISFIAPASLMRFGPALVWGLLFRADYKRQWSALPPLQIALIDLAQYSRSRCQSPSPPNAWILRHERNAPQGARSRRRAADPQTAADGIGHSGFSDDRCA